MGFAFGEMAKYAMPLLALALLMGMWANAMDTCDGLDDLDCGDGFETDTAHKHTLTKNANGCEIQIFHKECFCTANEGSVGNPTACCGDQFYKSIYCAKNTTSIADASDTANCATTMLDWITNSADVDGYIKRNEAAASAITDLPDSTAKWSQACPSKKEVTQLGSGYGGDKVTGLGGDQEDPVESRATEVNTKDNQENYAKRVCCEVMGTSDCDQYSETSGASLGCQYTDQGCEKNEIQVEVAVQCNSEEKGSSSRKLLGGRRRKKTAESVVKAIMSSPAPTCDEGVKVKIAIGASGDGSQATYEVEPMDASCTCAADWWDARNSIIQAIEDRRKELQLENLSDPDCPDFGVSASVQKADPDTGSCPIAPTVERTS